MFFFFFKQKTAYEIVDCDWSSDVCSSDLTQLSARSAIADLLIKPGIKGSDPDRDQIMSRPAFRLSTAKQI